MCPAEAEFCSFALIRCWKRQQDARLLNEALKPDQHEGQQSHRTPRQVTDMLQIPNISTTAAML